MSRFLACFLSLGIFFPCAQHGELVPPYQLKPPIPTNFFGPLKRIVFQHIRQTYHDDCQHFWPYFWPFERSLIAFKPISIAWLSIDILLSYCSLREYERILPSPSCLSICSSTSFSIYPMTCFLERWPEKSSTKSIVRRYEKCVSNTKSKKPKPPNLQFRDLGA